MSGAVYEQDDSADNSHDADVDAAYDGDQADDAGTGADGVVDNVGGLGGAGGDGDLGGAGGSSHAADQAAGFDDQ